MDLLSLVRREFPGIEIKYNPRDSLMPERGTLSVKKARDLIGYEPSFPLEKGFTNYVKGANIGGFVKVADAMIAQGHV